METWIVGLLILVVSYALALAAVPP